MFCVLCEKKEWADGAPLTFPHVLIKHLCVLCSRVSNWVICSFNSLLSTGNYWER